MYPLSRMDDYQPMWKAAELAGVTRKTIAKWVKAKLLKTRKRKFRHLVATLVSVKEVKELAKSRRPGRPRKASA
jgi:hypothetical protein